MLIVVIATAFLVVGCATNETRDLAKVSERELKLAYVDWDENIAITNLVKVLLEDETDYGEVRLEPVEVDAAFEDVASGKLDAYLSVWLPNQGEQVSAIEEDVATLNPWLIGTTRSSLAVPAYMEIRSLDQVESTGARRVLGVRRGASAFGGMPESAALSRYGLKKTEYPDTGAMLEEMDRLYGAGKPFVFVAWTPHPMNEVYDFNYLEDLEGPLEELNRPARLHMIVRKELQEEDPLAYELMDAILMAEHEITSLEMAVRKAETPEKGARVWVEDNRKLARNWVKSAERRSGEG